MKYMIFIFMGLFQFFETSGVQNCPNPKNMTSCKVIIPNRRFVLQGKPDTLVSKFTLIRKKGSFSK